MSGVPSVTYNPDFSEKWVLYLSPPEWRGRVSVEFRDVPLEHIQHAGCLTDPDVVDGWVTTLREGRQVPPPVVNATGAGGYYAHDGNHRLLAMRQVLGPTATVRVAVAVPQSGFRFCYRRFEQFGTYVLEPGPLRAYGIPNLAAIAAALVSVVLAAKAPNGAHEPSFAVAVGIVLVCARFAGWLSGLLATALTALSIAFFLLHPEYSFLIENPVLARELLISALIMLVLSFVVGYQPRNHGWRLLPSSRLAHWLDRLSFFRGPVQPT